MKAIRCPCCENELTEGQVHVKPTKNPKWVKIRCGLCRFAWKMPAGELGQKQNAADLIGI